jgi:hypothetical protein
MSSWKTCGWDEVYAWEIAFVSSRDPAHRISRCSATGVEKLNCAYYLPAILLVSKYFQAP